MTKDQIQMLSVEISLKLLGDYIDYNKNDGAFRLIKQTIERYLGEIKSNE